MAEAAQNPEPVPTSTRVGAEAAGSINDTIQNYAAYQSEVSELVNVVRRRGQELAETGPAILGDVGSSIKPQADELIAAVQDFSEAPIPGAAIAQTFTYASVLLVGAFFGSFIGSYIVGPILSLFLLKFGAVLLALVVFPLIAFGVVRRLQAAGSPDQEIRGTLGGLTLIQSLLVGFSISGHYANQPLIFLTPVIISFVLPAALRAVGNNRANVLGAALGASVAVHLLLGAISGNISFSYLLLTLAYAGIAGAAIQVLIKDQAAASTMQVYAYEFGIAFGFLIAKLIVFGLFGMSAAAGNRTQQH
ncbi:unnamed protein product [Caenorhabditis auriculariae]|uniref:Uncharacterized protein n=1 Tax=Caenorhabditis auriculariae TaxID=2777116 RepID=A0A8S1HVT4_9PELO|nr:unnamed protein product [Caenorhabditis auriculariae]